jgi:hypothetical protein
MVFMAYNLTDSVLASPNIPIAAIKTGLRDYMSIGVDQSQIVLVVPWFGVDFHCVRDTSPTPSPTPAPTPAPTPTPKEGEKKEDDEEEEDIVWENPPQVSCVYS